MSHPLAFLQEAYRELDEAFDWYEDQREGLGDEFMQSVQRTLSSVAESPLLHPVVYRDVRRALVKRFPYAVHYVLSDDQVVVIAIFHSSRDPARWQERR